MAESDCKPIASDCRATPPITLHQAFQQHVPMSGYDGKLPSMEHLPCGAPNTLWTPNSQQPHGCSTTLSTRILKFV